MTKLSDAAMVIATDPKISAWLRQNDPKALEQLSAALRGKLARDWQVYFPNSNSLLNVRARSALEAEKIARKELKITTAEKPEVKAW